MRTILAVILVFGSMLASAFAQQFRIATWQVPDVVMPKQTNATALAEPGHIKDIAAALSSADADVVILYGLTDGQALKRIGESMKPRKYSVAAHSVFRHGGSKGTVVGQPFGILARKERMSSKNIDWTDTGRIEMPGGFTFATFRHGAGAVCVYVANLPGSLTNVISSADGGYFSRKRNYAAEYLAHHASWVATTYTNQPFATYLTGDINLAPKKPVKDDCAVILEKGGFRAVSTGSTFDKSAFSITNGAALNRIFDPVFTKTIEFISSRQVVRPAPEQPMVICEITLRSSGSASILSPGRRSIPTPEPVQQAPAPLPEPALVQPAPIVAVSAPAVPLDVPPAGESDLEAPEKSAASGLSVQQRWLWPATGGIAFTLLAFIAMGIRRSKRRNISSALSRRTNDAVFVELNSPLPRPQKPSLEPGSQAVLSEPTTATDNAHNVIWQKSSVRVETETPADEARAGLMPHLKRLMREKLFIWLSHQRTQLLDSHETGTQKVLGLEERLEKIQDQFQDRLIAQQERIAELDKELQAKEKLISETLKEKSKQDNQQSNN